MESGGIPMEFTEMEKDEGETESMRKLHSIFKFHKISALKYWASSRQTMQWTFLLVDMEKK